MSLFFDDDGIEDIKQDISSITSDSKYVRNCKIPQYTPSNYCPSISEMMDTTKYLELIDEINNSNVDEANKRFLRLAAARHIVFNYSKVADYYVHADKELQELMEHSALVLIDLDDALARGFAKMDKRLVELAQASKAQEAEVDGE